MSWFGAPYSDLHVPDDLELCNCSTRTDGQLHSCKKHLSMELKCLFQYIVNQLKKGLGTELVVLEELIQQIANVQYTENMTDEQDAMSGSETLRLQSSLFGSTRNYKVLRGIKASFLCFMIR